MLKLPGYNGMRLAADCMGDSARQPVVFWHGGGQTRHSWGEALPVLSKLGFFPVSMDLRGHGDSDWASDGDYHLTSFARDAATVASYFNEKPVFVGASLGGLASMLAAGKAFGGGVKALVLVDVVPRINVEGAGNIKAFMMAAPDGFASLEEAADSIAAYVPHRKKPKNTDGLKKNLRLRDNGRYYWHWDARLFDSGGGGLVAEALLVEAARDMDIPVLLVHGELSDIVDEEGIRHFRDLLPHAQYQRVTGAGHMIAGDSNQQFSAVIEEFLGQFRR
jgi:non-heme chloroperoxidase